MPTPYDRHPLAASPMTKADLEEVNALLPQGQARMNATFERDILSDFAAGYTRERVQKRMKARRGVSFSLETIAEVRSRFAVELEAARALYEAEAVKEGLGRRAARIRRATQMVEALEAKLLDDDGDLVESPKTGTYLQQYRSYLEFIAKDAGSFEQSTGSDPRFSDKSDAELLEDLRKWMFRQRELVITGAELSGARPISPEETPESVADRVLGPIPQEERPL